MPSGEITASNGKRQDVLVGRCNDVTDVSAQLLASGRSVCSNLQPGLIGAGPQSVDIPGLSADDGYVRLDSSPPTHQETVTQTCVTWHLQILRVHTGHDCMHSR